MGESLSVEKPNDTILSPNGAFSAGFHSVGDNAYVFSVWFTESKDDSIVWTANRDYPVNGHRSRLTLQRDGHLILSDAGKSNVWTANTNASSASASLRLLDCGNLILHSTDDESTIFWQSFDHPTDTLLPTNPSRGT
ncbi:putative inactive G-type lectin S-receptor-like serine/threonine-protein kinase SRK [Acorus calamus]|uniref:Inactive G-type lectin S-receptor-like serine/threonine-protein kinase SRK n=1 Tax=Acorus calamus TaxID=4465 RepID=A0AAV9C3V1_ACOCL|nr:putative inactive G-type lectin S-receptor-like serine/threonine-protein kinase SRK [Acorus calamus]